jgi:hypothetical protein
MKTIHSLIAVLAITFASFTIARAALPAEASAKVGDPLPSWNDGPAKRPIIAFVEKVTTPARRSLCPSVKPRFGA